MQPRRRRRSGRSLWAGTKSSARIATSGHRQADDQDVPLARREPAQGRVDAPVVPFERHCDEVSRCRSASAPLHSGEGLAPIFGQLYVVAGAARPGGCRRQVTDAGPATRKEIADQMEWLSEGANSWQLTAATLVGLMSIPGLVVLYGGVMQKRWSVNSMMMSFVAFAIVLVLWCCSPSKWPSASRCTSSARQRLLRQHDGQAGLDPEQLEPARTGAHPGARRTRIQLPDSRPSPTSRSSSRRSRRS